MVKTAKRIGAGVLMLVKRDIGPLWWTRVGFALVVLGAILGRTIFHWIFMVVFTVWLTRCLGGISLAAEEMERRRG